MKNRRGFIRLKFFTRTNFKEISAGKENFGGFTIIELMIATVIFSVILLIMTSALILLGRIYFKGLVSVRTQEVARQIADDISQNIQFGGGTISSNPAPSGGIAGICIGSRQYSYILKQELTDTSGHKFVARTVSSSCPSSPLTSMDSLTNGQQELLGTNME